MMKDNFSNPNPFLSQAKQYQDLINQPTAADAMADANIRSMIPNPRNEGEILANSLSSGFAGGLKAHENQKRQEKLSPMLERAGQITAKAAELEAQMQDEQQTKINVEKFYRQVAPAMLERSKAALAGDISAVSELDKYIYGVLQKSVNDPSLGNYSHSNGSNTYFTNNETGVEEGRNLMQTMYQYGIDPAQIFGKDAMNVEIGYSPGAKLQYEDERKMLAAELGVKQSTANVNNAHARNYNAQTNKTKHEMNNPQMSPEQYKANAKLAEFNRNLIKDEIKPKIEANERMLGSLEALDQIAIESPGIVGSDELTKMMRSVGESFGLDPNIDYAKLKSVEFEKMLKPILGAQLGEKEGERVLSKFPSIGTSKVALRKFIAEEIPKIKEEIVKGNQLVNAYNREYHTNLYNPDIHQNLEGDIERYTNERIARKNKNTNSNDLSDLQ